MWILIVGLVLLAIVAMIAGYIRNKRLQKKIDNGELDSFPEVKEVDVECCGQHEVCEHPAQLKFVMIDPKKVEFSLYAKIERHFLAKMESEDDAIITDPKKAVYTLNSL